MLCEKVFAVEVVVIKYLVVFGVCGWRAEIAAPVAELDVLGANVALPFVLGGKGWGAAICGEGAGEWTSVVVSFGWGFGGAGCFAGSLDCFGGAGRTGGLGVVAERATAFRGFIWAALRCGWASSLAWSTGAVVWVGRGVFGDVHRLHGFCVAYWVANTRVGVLWVAFRNSVRLQNNMLVLAHCFLLQFYSLDVLHYGLGRRVFVFQFPETNKTTWQWGIGGTSTVVEMLNRWVRQRWSQVDACGTPVRIGVMYKWWAKPLLTGVTGIPGCGGSIRWDVTVTVYGKPLLVVLIVKLAFDGDLCMENAVGEGVRIEHEALHCWLHAHHAVVEVPKVYGFIGPIADVLMLIWRGVMTVFYSPARITGVVHRVRDEWQIYELECSHGCWSVVARMGRVLMD
jgi:hypothetical protein